MSIALWVHSQAVKCELFSACSPSAPTLASSAKVLPFLLSLPLPFLSLRPRTERQSAHPRRPTAWHLPRRSKTWPVSLVVCKQRTTATMIGKPPRKWRRRRKGAEGGMGWRRRMRPRTTRPAGGKDAASRKTPCSACEVWWG